MTTTNYRQALIDKIETSVTQSHIKAGSIETAYLSSGAGQPLILLHGAGAGAVTWYPSIGAISKHFHVIAPDIVGYGESDKPEASYDRAYFSKWLKDFLSALNIPKVHIVGLSQGGAVALQFVLDNPEMVDKLVLVDSGGLGAQPTLAAFLGMIWLNSFPSSLANRFFSRYLLFDPENRDPNHGWYSIDVLKRKGGKNAFKQGRGSAVSEIPKASLRKIQNKTLVIWGESDRLFPVEYGVSSTSEIANAKFLKIKDAGHLPLMDQTDTFNEAVVDFLN
ncbi:alpha/beta fold hydrolase [Nitrincola iocasae]|uniref:Alpha/beta hydrolase n=1 Tax=Nitrincola iocasae TaxID=2614693 RepID=A0A5J6LDW9_9GAMM|nr:alpha/beta hydrolase [Nitrincola iocasae]QEW06623.1 alpha/beta hydrolase [Nitrincola iocasae]